MEVDDELGQALVAQVRRVTVGVVKLVQEPVQQGVRGEVVYTSRFRVESSLRNETGIPQSH